MVLVSKEPLWERVGDCGDCQLVYNASKEVYRGGCEDGPEFIQYGVGIRKYKSGALLEEKYVPAITGKLGTMEALFEMLARFEVTPVTLADIAEDYVAGLGDCCPA